MTDSREGVQGTQRSTPAGARGGKQRRRRAPGWVPNQHGAWAMLVAPVLVGSWPTFAWRQLLLLVVAIAAYLALYAVGLWLKAGRKPRYLPAARTYAIIAATLLGLLVLSQPRLLAWAPAYGAGIVLSLLASRWREDRSWWNDIVLVILACGATLVAAGLRPVAGGVAVPAIAPSPMAWPPPGLNEGWALTATAILLAYFLGTVVHVKAMIRNRNDPGVYFASVLYHAAVLVVAVLTIAWTGGAFALLVLGDGHIAWGPWLLLLTATALLARAILVPRRWPGLSPRGIGLVELVATVLVMATAIVFAHEVLV